MLYWNAVLNAKSLNLYGAPRFFQMIYNIHNNPVRQAVFALFCIWENSGIDIQSFQLHSFPLLKSLHPNPNALISIMHCPRKWILLSPSLIRHIKGGECFLRPPPPQYHLKSFLSWDGKFQTIPGLYQKKEHQLGWMLPGRLTLFTQKHSPPSLSLSQRQTLSLL